MSLSSSTVVRLPLAEASEFGKYQLIAKLGQGGMAEVFLAVHRDPVGFEKLVVVKRLKAVVAADPEMAAMFLDEARIAARLNHPNLVQTHEFGSVEDQHYLAMEYLEGQPLDRIVHRLGYEERLGVYLAIVSDALAGLHHAHELCDFDGKPLQVVHRDVSPHNLFVTYEGQVKVVDFGIAKWVSRSAEATSTGVVKGKVSYMAPEQALSGPLDRRADLFAAGVILWEVAAGERLWGNLSEVQILQRMAFGEIPELGDRAPHAPVGLRRICSRALSVDPAGRYATAAEMRDDIEALLATLGRRLTGAELGQLVADAFADRRAEARAVIGEQLRRVKEGEGAEEALPLLDDRAGPLSVRGRSISQRRELPAGPEATPATAVAAPPPVAPAAERPGRRMAAAVATLLGAAVVGAGLVAALQGVMARPAPATTAATTGAEHPRGQGAAPQAPERELIELRISAAPATAKLFLDDVEVPSNPFSAKFPRDGTGHRIRAEADGFAPEARLVVFDGDIALDLALSPPPAGALPREAAAGRPSTPAGPTTGASLGRAVPSPGATSPRPVEPAGVAPPASASAQPAGQGPKVDTSDPWSRKPR